MTFEILTTRVIDLALGALLSAAILMTGLHRSDVMSAVLKAESGNSPVTFTVTCAANTAGDVTCLQDNPSIQGD